MKMLKFLFIIIILHTTMGQWVDPHSMDTYSKSKLPNESKNAPGENVKTCTTVTQKGCVSDVHLRRLVRIILNNAYLNDEPGYHEGYLNIKLSALERQLLINFSQGMEIEEHVLNEVASIFENAFLKPAAERYQETVLLLEERIYMLLFNPTTGALVGAAFTLYLAYKLLKAQFTWKSIIKYFVFLAYITDVIVTYLQIVREEEIDSMVTIKKLGTAPPECDPKKMSWWDFIKTELQSNFMENPCKVYYQATYQNYFFIIGPSKVLTRQFRTLIVEPFGDMGEAFGKFGRGMFTTLPWGLNVVLFPVMLITAVAMVFVVFLFITKPRFKLSLFNLFAIELGSPEKNQPLPAPINVFQRRIGYTPNKNKVRKTGRKEVGITAKHRNLVEDLSNHSNSQREIKEHAKKEEQDSSKQLDVVKKKSRVKARNL